jgi:recombination protein RecA
MLSVKCIECGTEFEAERSTAKFCSDKCRVKWNSKKTEEVLSSTLGPIPPSDEKKKAVRSVMDQINEKMGAGTIMLLGDKPLRGIEVISTGSLGLDQALGVGGLPRGRITEIFGPEGSGKTTIAIHVMAEAQRKGLNCLMIDAEHAFDPEYAEVIGVKIDELRFCQPDYGEQALEVVDRYLLGGDGGVIVIDSVAALVPKGELEGEMGDSKMGLHARLMSQACRKLAGMISKTNTLVIFINQLRSKIGQQWGPAEVTTGGMALPYYSSVRLDVRGMSVLKDGEEVSGRRTKVRVVKNKVSPPFRWTEFDIVYGRGISKAGELVDNGVATGVIKQSGAWYSHGDNKLGQGRDQVIELLESNEEFAGEIEEAIILAAQNGKL